MFLGYPGTNPGAYTGPDGCADHRTNARAYPCSRANT